MVDSNKVNESYEVLNHTPVGICIINHEYQVVFWNKTLQNWTQIADEDVLSKKLTDVFPHLNTPKYLSRIETVLNGGAPSIFSSQLHKNLFPSQLPDGRNRIQHTTVAAIPALEDSGLHYACIVIEDVSELTQRIYDYRIMRDKAVEENKQRQKAEKALRESENRLRGFMDSATECFIVCDANLNILEINQAGLNIFKITNLNSSKKKTKLLSDYIDEFKEQSWQQLFQSVIGDGHSSQKQLSLGDFSADEIHLNVNIFKVNDGLGIIAEDITEQINYEKKLQYTLSELKRSNQELEQFGYIISHDLQEPIRMVSSYMQLISRKYSSKLDEDADDFIQYAVDGATRIQKMIKDLLRFSQFSSQSQSFKKIDLNLLVKNVLADLSVLISENNVVVNVDELPSVVADATQMSQLFLNLLNNAIKYKSDEDPIINIQCVLKEKEWIFSIKDNGVGIPEKETERIFGIFQKLHIAKDYNGTGMGLTICKKIIECHEGRIWVESVPGKGSVFSFALPIKEK